MPIPSVPFIWNKHIMETMEMTCSSAHRVPSLRLTPLHLTDAPPPLKGFRQTEAASTPRWHSANQPHFSPSPPETRSVPARRRTWGTQRAWSFGRSSDLPRARAEAATPAVDGSAFPSPSPYSRSSSTRVIRRQERYVGGVAAVHVRQLQAAFPLTHQPTCDRMGTNTHIHRIVRLIEPVHALRPHVRTGVLFLREGEDSTGLLHLLLRSHRLPSFLFLILPHLLPNPQVVRFPT